MTTRAQEWNSGYTPPAHGRPVLALMKLPNFGYKDPEHKRAWVIARWDDFAKDWHVVDHPNATGHQSPDAPNVSHWRELPTPPSGIEAVVPDEALRH